MLGFRSVQVVRRPRVRLLILASEGNPDVNGALLRALVTRDGGVPEAPIYPGRRPESLERSMEAGGADLVLAAGGTGFGIDDHAVASARERGARVEQGIAMHPGETAALGMLDDRPLVLLPGWPLACLVAYEMLAGRALRRLAGGSGDWPHGSVTGRLTRKIASALGRLQYCRVRLDAGAVEPLAVADGHSFATVARADGFVLVPPNSEGYPEGTEVRVYPYGSGPP
jgi:molybdopterin molybdotransferase